MKPKQFFSALAYSIKTCFTVSPVRYLTVILLNFAIYAAPFAVTAIWKITLDQLSLNITGRILLLIAAYIGVTAAGNCAESVKIYLEHIVEENAVIKTDEDFIKQAACVGMEYFDNPEKTDELSLIGRKTRQVFFLQQSFWEITLGIVAIISAIVLVAQNIPWAIAILLAAYIPKIIIDTKNQKRVYEDFDATETERRKQEYYVQTVTEKRYAQDVRLYGIIGMLLNRYRASYQVVRKLMERQHRKETVGVVIAMLFGWFGIGGVLIITIIAAVNGKITIGDVQYDFGLATQLAERIDYASVTLAYIASKVLAVSTHIAFINKQQDAVGKRVYNKDDNPVIEFRDVSFRYPTSEKDVLSNVSFTIGPNERVALVGINGAGKTTIVKLLLGLYPPTGGKIYVNGVDIREYDPDSLHRIVSVMFQNHQEYAFSVADNITMFSDRNDDALRDAMKESGISDMIASWECGADTCITHRFDAQGKELSGGQAQKLALARSLYRRDAKLYIMDEPSASLDAEAEDELFRNLLNLSRDASALFITHRMSMCASADRVILIEDGRVLENGTHTELLAENGRYAYLYGLQAQQYTDGLANGGEMNE